MQIKYSPSQYLSREVLEPGPEPPSPWLKIEKTYNSKTAYVNETRVGLKYDSLQYIRNGTWTMALAPPISKKGGKSPSYTDFHLLWGQAMWGLNKLFNIQI